MGVSPFWSSLMAFSFISASFEVRLECVATCVLSVTLDCVRDRSIERPRDLYTILESAWYNRVGGPSLARFDIRMLLHNPSNTKGKRAHEVLRKFSPAQQDDYIDRTPYTIGVDVDSFPDSERSTDSSHLHHLGLDSLRPRKVCSCLRHLPPPGRTVSSNVAGRRVRAIGSLHLHFLVRG